MVTGGARRLGKDIAHELAGAGFDIVLNYNSAPEDILQETLAGLANYNVKIFPVKADVSKVSEIREMFAKVKAEFGRLDVLVNNAAIFEKVNLLDVTEEVFDRFIDTNLKSVLFCTQEAVKIMRGTAEEPGCIINIASLGALMNWTQFMMNSLTKTAVVKLTKISAKQLAPDILVNALALGTVVIENDENRTVDADEVKRYPAGRFAVSKDVTKVIKHLACENNYITGDVFVIDGGRIL